MSFVWKANRRLRTPERVASEVKDVALARGLDDFAAVLAVMCIAQESDFWCPWNAKDPTSKNYEHDSQSDDGRSVAYFQQQNGVAGENPPGNQNWWGPMSSRMDLRRSCDMFLSRLQDNYHDAEGNPALASEFISNVQRPREDLRGEYAKHWNRAWQLVRVADGGQPSSPGPWRGDPVWLADVLRAEGLSVVEMDGWLNRGQGDFGEIWGVIAHHTGSDNASPESIAFHPELGLASQIHLARNGVVTMCGVGLANHAGKGSWAGIPLDSANQMTIGIEAACLPREGAPHREHWPDVQYDAYVKTVAAILRRLGHRSDHCIAHREWARFGPAGWRQGKWDPGAIDMNIFRADIQRRIDSKTGASDDMAQVPQEQWDRFFREWTEVMESLSIYRTPGEGGVATIKRFIQVNDKFAHEEYIERAARYGDEDAIRRVTKVALGQGADTSPESIARARNVLDEIEHILKDQES